MKMSPLCHPDCPGVPWDRSGGICARSDLCSSAGISQSSGDAVDGCGDGAIDGV